MLVSFRVIPSRELGHHMSFSSYCNPASSPPESPEELRRRYERSVGASFV